MFRKLSLLQLVPIRRRARLLTFQLDTENGIESGKHSPLLTKISRRGRKHAENKLQNGFFCNGLPFVVRSIGSYTPTTDIHDGNYIGVFDAKHLEWK